MAGALEWMLRWVEAERAGMLRMMEVLTSGECPAEESAVDLSPVTIESMPRNSLQSNIAKWTQSRDISALLQSGHS